MRQIVLSAALLLSAGVTGQVHAASPLQGKNYIIHVSSTQSDSGYAAYLLPPMARAITRAGLKPAKRGPGAELVFNVVTHSDVGQWMEVASGREWLYTVTITIGISPESYVIPYEGTPQFGVAVSLITPNGDREDELACLIELATREAIARYQPKGLIKLSGQACLRRP
jgi:hypothetical protein